jgi:hypothetical protein
VVSGPSKQNVEQDLDAVVDFLTPLAMAMGDCTLSDVLAVLKAAQGNEAALVLLTGTMLGAAAHQHAAEQRGRRSL